MVRPRRPIRTGGQAEGGQLRWPGHRAPERAWCSAPLAGMHLGLAAVMTRYCLPHSSECGAWQYCLNGARPLLTCQSGMGHRLSAPEKPGAAYGADCPGQRQGLSYAGIAPAAASRRQPPWWPALHGVSLAGGAQHEDLL